MQARKPHVPNFEQVTSAFMARAEDIVHREVRNFADRERDTFVNKIEQQRFDSFHAFPLSPRTILKKRRLRLSQRVMISTKQYVKAIKVYEEPIRQKDGIGPNGAPSTTGTRIIIGIHPNAKAKDEETGTLRWDTPLQFVAKIHEYGAPRANIPARPHWGPHLRLMHERAVRVRRQIAQLVAAEWQRTIAATSQVRQ